MSNPTESTPAHKPRSFRRAVLRGLAVVLPPLLTVVIFLWVGSIVNDYLFATGQMDGPRYHRLFVRQCECNLKTGRYPIAPRKHLAR